MNQQAQPPSHGSTDLLQRQEMYIDYHPSDGPVRTEVEKAERFQPSGSYCARALGNANMEAGPSTPILSRIPSVGPPIMQPPGGIPETTADAEKDQTHTEKDKTPVSHFYRSHTPHVSN
jgi:hypothetical protein